MGSCDNGEAARRSWPHCVAAWRVCHVLAPRRRMARMSLPSPRRPPGSATWSASTTRLSRRCCSKPANLDVLFRFASLASQTGDLEGAISALERMLLINPDLPRVRLELGVLYYRLGSYEVARTYLEGALKSPTLPRRRAQPGRAVPGPDREQAEAVAASAARSSSAGATSRTPISARRPRACCLFGQAANLNQAGHRRRRLGRRELVQVRPASLRPRQPGQGGARDPASPAMPTASSRYRPPTSRCST